MRSNDYVMCVDGLAVTFATRNPLLNGDNKLIFTMKKQHCVLIEKSTVTVIAQRIPSNRDFLSRDFTKFPLYYIYIFQDLISVFNEGL